MKCKNCGKEKKEHVNERWCYKTSEFIASSSDWQEFVKDEGGEE